ncbi:MAG: Crp/Fnr family transcriptional regulator [Kiloniellales bacterium]|nr:Crp/Fnr family transcriptional regulator [Kiloniellales bacterium]
MSFNRESVELKKILATGLLSQLRAPELDDFLNLCKTEVFTEGQVIFHKGAPGECLYAILGGRVGINTLSDEGREIFLNIMEPGQVFGEIALLDGRERTAGAVAMGPTKLLRVDRKDFVPFLEKHPALCIRMMEILCQRLRWTSDIIEDTIFLNIPRRLAKRLLTLTRGHGSPSREGIKLDIKLSQEELGNMLGATRESTNKSLRLLQEQGVITYDRGGYIIVTDVKTLELMVQGEEAD